jgi:hypothetical protein
MSTLTHRKLKFLCCTSKACELVHGFLIFFFFLRKKILRELDFLKIFFGCLKFDFVTDAIFHFPQAIIAFFWFEY